MEVGHCELISCQSFVQLDSFVGFKTVTHNLSCSINPCNPEEAQYKLLKQFTPYHTTPYQPSKRVQAYSCTCIKQARMGSTQTDLEMCNVVLLAGGSCIADKAGVWLVAARRGSASGGRGQALRTHVGIACRCATIG